MRPIKRCFIDTETTGLDSAKCGIIQIAGIIDINDVIQEEFVFSMNPPDTKVIQEEALAVNGITVEQIAGYPSSATIFQQVTGILNKYVKKYDKTDKFVFLAYNAMFDMGFVKRWFEDNGDKYFNSLFYRYPIDIASHAMEATLDDHHLMPNFKLSTMIEKFQIQPDGDLHDALVDIRVSRQLYYRTLYRIHQNVERDTRFDK